MTQSVIIIENLINAIKAGSVATVEDILARNKTVDLNQENSSGSFPLLCAVQIKDAGKRLAILDLLLKAGADVNYIKSGEAITSITALEAAIGAGFPDAVERLLAAPEINLLAEHAYTRQVPFSYAAAQLDDLTRSPKATLRYYGNNQALLDQRIQAAEKIIDLLKGPAQRAAHEVAKVKARKDAKEFLLRAYEKHEIVPEVLMAVKYFLNKGNFNFAHGSARETLNALEYYARTGKPVKRSTAPHWVKRLGQEKTGSRVTPKTLRPPAP